MTDDKERIKQLEKDVEYWKEQYEDLRGEYLEAMERND
jgi:hypothetical protein